MEREKPAGFVRRAAALGIDCILIQFACVILTLVALGAVRVSAWVSGLPDPSRESVALLWISLPVVWFLLPFLYFTFFLTFGGQTPAKMMTGVRVIATRSGRLTAARALFRTLGYCISAVPLGLGFLWIFTRSDRRAFHDLLAGTRVIRRV